MSEESSTLPPIPISAVLVDDQPLVRAGVAALLSDAGRVEIIGEAADGIEALEVIGRLRPDVVLMDITMPCMDGPTATRKLCCDPGLQDVKVVALTTFDSEEHIAEALQAGACGFVLKDAEASMIIRAIEAAVAGQPCPSAE